MELEPQGPGFVPRRADLFTRLSAKFLSLISALPDNVPSMDTVLCQMFDNTGSVSSSQGKAVSCYNSYTSLLPLYATLT